jgi:hypothetical protein
MQYFEDAIAKQPFREIGTRLETEIRSAVPRLAGYTDAQAGVALTAGKWSRKQVLGHLIDSAANNHQRFVRLQAEGDLRLPGYAQEQWVALQRYQDRPWADLVELWSAYNRHLAYLIAAIPEASRDVPCTIGDDPPVTLSHVALDYVGHLQHHLGQIFA